MKAVVYRNYGPPDVLTVEDVDKPVPADNEVLIRVQAASVNPIDWHFMRGTPLMMRAMLGLRKPRLERLGYDVAGHVEAVGRRVTRFKPGDQVFGDGHGSFAECACASEETLGIKPDALSYDQAAALPVAAITALQALRDKGKIRPGMEVLINGAAGGVGTFAVQLAKHFGARVTGVCSTRNIELLRSLGADRVIDYTQTDFADEPRRYDLFLDCFLNHSLSQCRRVLNPGGTYVVVGGPNGPELKAMGRMFASFLISTLSGLTKRKVAMFVAKPNQKDLEFLGDLVATGKLKTTIDRCYKLAQTAEAIRYLEEGHARGKVIIDCTSS